MGEKERIDGQVEEVMEPIEAKDEKVEEKIEETVTEPKKRKREKKKSSPVEKLITLVLIGIIAFSAYKVGTILYGYYEGNQQYTQVQQVAGVEKGEEFTGDIDFNSLYKQNKDVKAWIYSEGTVINYPVVQAADNDYYLYRMFNGEYNGAGSIFIDYRNSTPFESFNTIIHGHRMKDGSMFKPLIQYRDMSYFNEHKVMQITTPDMKYDLEIFAVVTIPADSNMYKLNFTDDEERQDYLDKIYKKSEIDTGVEATPDDRIVMMSTCDYEFDDARLCVYGKLVPTGRNEQ